MVAYHRGRMLVFDWQTLPVLCPTNSWTGDHSVGKLSHYGSANEANSAFHPSAVDK